MRTHCNNVVENNLFLIIPEQAWNLHILIVAPFIEDVLIANICFR